MRRRHRRAYRAPPQQEARPSGARNSGFETRQDRCEGKTVAPRSASSSEPAPQRLDVLVVTNAHGFDEWAPVQNGLQPALKTGASES
jgi:hypothetical protein